MADIVAQRDARIGELNLRLGKALAEIERLRTEKRLLENRSFDQRTSLAELHAALSSRDAEIERLREQLQCAEIGLSTWDDGLNSEYWPRYRPEALDDQKGDQG